MIFLQLSSHFCAIQSCFIFSKIVYKVTNKLNRLATDMEQVNFQYENRATAARVPIVENDADLANLINSDDREEVDRGRYYWLQKLDQNFIQQVKPILDLFGVWFIFHWTLYALTTVLLSAFIIQIITEFLQYNLKSVNSFLPNGEADTKAPYVLYVVFFTLVHAYLFLYPCCCDCYCPCEIDKQYFRKPMAQYSFRLRPVPYIKELCTSSALVLCRYSH